MAELPQDPENPHRHPPPGVPADSGAGSSGEDSGLSQAAGGGVDEDTEEIAIAGSSARGEADLDEETILEPIIREGLEAAETRERPGPLEPPPAPPAPPPRVAPGRAAPADTAPTEQPIELLEGEAETLPLALPFSLRPRSDGDLDEGEDSSEISRWSGRYYLAWSSVGCVVGMLIFLYMSFAPRAMLEPRFPAIEVQTVVMDSAAVRADEPASWDPLDDLYLLTTPDSKIAVYNVSQQPPRRIALFEPGAEGEAGRLSFVGKLKIEGFFMVAGVSRGRVWWRPIDAAEPGGSITFGADFEIPFAPVTVENWNAQRIERFLVAGHDEAEGFLLSIDPLSLEGDRRYQVEDRFVAPIVSVFDPAVGAGRGALLVTGTKGVSLIDSTGPDFESFGSAEFSEPWPVDQEGSIARMRFEENGRGWLVATAGRFALIQYDSRGPRLIDEGTFESGEESPPGSALIATFPDGNDPERDQAFVLLPSGIGAWISLDSGGKAVTDEIELSGRRTTRSIAADDLNGDGFWDLVGIEDDGSLWVLDGETRQEVSGGLLMQTAHEVSGEVLWRQTPSGLECLYPSGDEKWVQLSIPCSVSDREELRTLLAKDWKWRSEATTFTGG